MLRAFIASDRSILWGILLLALLLRLIGINFGLPFLYHADEPIVVNHAVAVGAGNFDPVHLKITHFVSHLVFISYGVYYVLLRVLGNIAGVEDFGKIFLTDPSSFYLIARVVFGALLGTATVLMLYRLMARFFSSTHAALAAFFLASNFLHVRNSHYIYLDIPLLFFLVCSYFPILSILESPRRRDYVVFGCLVALGAASKHNGVFVVVPFLLAHFTATGWRPSNLFTGNLMVGGLTAVAVFVLCNPLIWLMPQRFLTDMSTIHDFQGYIGWGHHFFYSLWGSVGIPMLLLSLGGIAAGFVQPDAKRGVFSVFLIVYYGVLVIFSQHHARYVLPLIPFLAVFAADALVKMKERWSLPGWVMAALIVLVAAPPMAKVFFCDLIMARKDVRTVAYEWIQGHLPAGSSIALDTPLFVPHLKPTVPQLLKKKEEMMDEGAQAQVKRLKWMIDGAEADNQKRFELYFLSEHLEGGYLFSEPRLPYDVDALIKAGIEYVVFAKVDPKDQPAFYESLKALATEIKRFSPYRDKRAGWSSNSMPLTGAPFLWRELSSRTRMGHVIEVYKLPVLSHKD